MAEAWVANAGASFPICSWMLYISQVGKCVSNWSAHDFMPGDKLPYIGYLHPATHTIFTGTGFAKWGIAVGAAGANIICDLIESVPNPFYSAVKVRKAAGGLVFFSLGFC